MPLCCMKQHRNLPGKIWCTQCNSLMVGATIGDYVIDSHLGQGSTSAAVYLAHQPKLNDRKVVIKVLQSSVASQESIDTFRKEAALLAALSHPYILPIYDYDIIEEARVDQMGHESYSPYLVLRYAEQGSLEDIFKREGHRPWSLQRVLPIIKEAAEALDYAHQARPRNILHRDIKPANILMVGTHIMLADFGVADLIDVEKSSLDAPWAGSPAYMAPEVWRFKPGRYSDQYALAVMCFRLLTGEYPWKVLTGGTDQWRQVHQNVPPQPIRSLRPDLPIAVESVLQRALAKEPHDRYPDVSTFALELRKAAQDETQPLVQPPRLKLPERPLVEAMPSPVPGVPRQPSRVQVEKESLAPPGVGSASTSSINSLPEELQQNGKHPRSRNMDTESRTGERSRKLQVSGWMLSALFLNVVICVALVAVGRFSQGAGAVPLLVLSLWPALLVGPLVGYLFHRVTLPSYPWGMLWGMIFGIVNAFLSALVCCAWRVLSPVLPHAGPGSWVSQLEILLVSQQFVLLLLIGLWMSVCGGALIGLLAARTASAVPSTHQL